MSLLFMISFTFIYSCFTDRLLKRCRFVLCSESVFSGCVYPTVSKFLTYDSYQRPLHLYMNELSVLLLFGLQFCIYNFLFWVYEYN